MECYVVMPTGQGTKACNLSKGTPVRRRFFHPADQQHQFKVGMCDRNPSTPVRADALAAKSTPTRL